MESQNGSLNDTLQILGKQLSAEVASGSELREKVAHLQEEKLAHSAKDAHLDRMVSQNWSLNESLRILRERLSAEVDSGVGLREEVAQLQQEKLAHLAKDAHLDRMVSQNSSLNESLRILGERLSAEVDSGLGLREEVAQLQEEKLALERQKEQVCVTQPGTAAHSSVACTSAP